MDRTMGWVAGGECQIVTSISSEPIWKELVRRTEAGQPCFADVKDKCE